MNEMNLPEHWKIARLGEVTEIVKGATPSGYVKFLHRYECLIVAQGICVPQC